MNGDARVAFERATNRAGLAIRATVPVSASRQFLLLDSVCSNNLAGYCREAGV
jgi:hypothetical protein